MNDTPLAKKSSRGFRRLFRLLSRPVRRTGERGGLVILAYRGYGHRNRILLMGRVLKQPAWGSGDRRGGLFGDLLNIAKRFVRYGIADMTVVARAGGGEAEVRTDRDGYFEIDMRVPGDDDWQGIWRPVDLSVRAPDAAGVHARGSIFVPPETCRYVVVSDIDDTVMFTGVANKLKMLWRLFATEAESRLAFPGVGAFYRGLHEGPSGSEQNPMLYVSRAPWGIYEVLEEFFNLHEIPEGPVLFLREWGVTLQHPLPKQSKGHKHGLIEDMLAIYDDLPFVLIGDSGQRDPEIYSEVVRQHRSRVLAVYIRDVSRDPTRIEAIEALAEEVANAGSTLVLASDSHAMAEHAVDRDLIAPDVLQRVKRAQESDLKKAGQTPDRARAKTVSSDTPAETREAVETGRLKETLDDADAADRPKKVVLE